MSRSRVFKWYKRFIEIRNGVEDEQCVGCPCSLKTDDNVSKTKDNVRNYRRMSIRTMAGTVNVDKETVRQISHD